jgi:hypothetical protein
LKEKAAQLPGGLFRFLLRLGRQLFLTTRGMCFVGTDVEERAYLDAGRDRMWLRTAEACRIGGIDVLR